jgi:hypothetical protein
MATRTNVDGAKHRNSAALNHQEKALLAITAMNKGTIPEIRLKRIYLERYSFWELQHTEESLVSKGLLEKDPMKDGTNFEYVIQKEHLLALAQSYSPEMLVSLKDEHMNPHTPVCCADYSVLWYLWKLDITSGGLILPKKSRRDSLATEKTMEEYLGLEREGLRFLKGIAASLSGSAFWIYDGFGRWSDVLAAPHKLVSEIFALARDTLRAGGELGRDEVGFDNMDLLFDELGRLSVGEWYGFHDFAMRARNLLFSANQPFRWMHFEEERVWSLLSQKIRVLGVVETATNSEGEHAIRLTSLGAFCLGELSAREFLKDGAARTGRLIVHPNFEVTLVSREMDPSVLLKLAMFTEPVNLDTATVLRITKGSVVEGMNLGLKTGEMIALLKDNSRGEIPQNVEYSITDWVG